MITRAQRANAWTDPAVTLDSISGRFWNMVLWDQAVYAALEPLLELFAVPEPDGQGRYNHHNGLQPA